MNSACMGGMLLLTSFFASMLDINERAPVLWVQPDDSPVMRVSAFHLDIMCPNLSASANIFSCNPAICRQHALNGPTSASDLWLSRSYINVLLHAHTFFSQSPPQTRREERFSFFSIQFALDPRTPKTGAVLVCFHRYDTSMATHALCAHHTSRNLAIITKVCLTDSKVRLMTCSKSRIDSSCL